MTHLQRLFLSFFFIISFCIASDHTLAATAGKDYQIINPPQATSSVGKIEVLEFFSYGLCSSACLLPLVVMSGYP